MQQHDVRTVWCPMDLTVTIITTKNCGYSSLKTWLAQNQMSPGAQAYTTKSNDLVEMMNNKTFESDPFKPKDTRNRNRDRKKKKEDKKTVGAILKSSPNEPTPANLE